MKLHLYTCVILFLLSIPVVKAQDKALADAIESFKAGLQNADRTLLESIAAEQLVYGHSNGKVQNKAEFVAEIVSKKPLTYANVQLSQQSIQHSGHTAVVRHILSAEISNNGTPGNLKIGNMLIWQKQKGKWKLLARQAYKL